MEKDHAEDSFAIRTKTHWRALWHPLRIGILRLLRQQEMTNEELARALGVPSGKLFHHTKLLLEAGLIEPAGTRQKRAITEKLYRAVAGQFFAGFDPISSDPLTEAVESGFRLYENTLKLAPGVFQTGGHAILTVPPERAQVLEQHLREIVEEARNTSPPPNAVPIAITLLIHALPTVTPPRIGGLGGPAAILPTTFPDHSGDETP